MGTPAKISMVLLLALLIGQGIAGAQAARPIEVPAVLLEPHRSALVAKRSALENRRTHLLAAVETHNGRCRGIPDSSPMVAECSEAQARLNGEVDSYRDAANAFNREVAQAAQARRAELDKQIERDMEAIRRLGFARRAEDFAEWERLAAKAKAEFKGEVIDTVTDIAVDKARGKILDAFKTFDAAKASRMITWIKSKNIKPQPAALIAAIERVGRATDKSRIAADAEFIVKQIEDWRKARAAAADPIESAKFVGGMLEGFISDPRLAILITEVKLTTAALYNNATRRVALAEVNRLTDLTEQQLKGLDRLRQVLQKHVHERNDLKSTMKEAEK